MKVDAKKLKNRLTLDDYKKIMKALDIPAFAENKDNIIYWSGEKNKIATNGSPKLYFYKSTGIYVGYTSSASYDIISLCQKRLALLNQPSSFIDSLNFILSVTNIDPDVCQRITKKQTYNWEDELGKYLRFRKNGSMLPTYDINILNELDTAIPQQWINEGITIETMEKYHIGYYERCNQTTIPCFGKNGELYGIRCRNWHPDRLEQAKYIPLILLSGKSYSFPTNKLFYGINYNWAAIEKEKTVWLGESEKFTLKLDSWYGQNNLALSMFGKNLGTERRNELLKMGVNKVIYVVDNDWIGKSQEEYDLWEKEIFDFAKIFKGYCEFDVVYDNLNLLNPKDNATDKDFDTWIKLYNNREKIY